MPVRVGSMTSPRPSLRAFFGYAADLDVLSPVVDCPGTRLGLSVRLYGVTLGHTVLILEPDFEGSHYEAFWMRAPVLGSAIWVGGVGTRGAAATFALSSSISRCMRAMISSLDSARALTGAL